MSILCAYLCLFIMLLFSKFQLMKMLCISFHLEVQNYPPNTPSASVKMDAILMTQRYDIESMHRYTSRSRSVSCSTFSMEIWLHDKKKFGFCFCSTIQFLIVIPMSECLCFVLCYNRFMIYYNPITIFNYVYQNNRYFFIILFIYHVCL